MEPALKRTPLFAAHQKLGGKIVEFGGWEMPVQYTSIVDEHQAVRQAAGLFDISHMGEVAVSGAGAAAFLNRVLTNDIRKLTPGQGQYTLMCNLRGGVVDDLYAYCLAPAKYLLIINASRIADDVAWLQGQASALAGASELNLLDTSNDMGAVALQGPRVTDFINGCFPSPSHGGMAVAQPTGLKKNETAAFDFESAEVWVSRTGYTGEDGFELVAPAAKIEVVWNRLLSAGKSFGLKPAGLGARDTLRTEVCYPLYGHELDTATTPIEAGLGFFVGWDKDFNGKAVLAEQKAKGTSRKLAAFKMADKCAPPRPQYPIWNKDAAPSKVGHVASGTQSPTLGVGIGMGYVPVEFAKAGTALEIEIRGRRAPAVVVAKPFYRRSP